MLRIRPPCRNGRARPGSVAAAAGDEARAELPPSPPRAGSEMGRKEQRPVFRAMFEHLAPAHRRLLLVLAKARAPIGFVDLDRMMQGTVYETLVADPAFVPRTPTPQQLHLGIGTALTALVQHSLRRRKAVQDSRRKDLEARYRVVILLMYAAVDFGANRAHLRIHRPDLETEESVLQELEAEWVNMTLFASIPVLTSLRSFIRSPSKASLPKAAKDIRKDLGRGHAELRWE